VGKIGSPLGIGQPIDEFLFKFSIEATEEIEHEREAAQSRGLPRGLSSWQYSSVHFRSATPLNASAKRQDAAEQEADKKEEKKDEKKEEKKDEKKAYL